ncbi:hypothetical protein [uncultured Roseobacter sp.]|uniref:hypothetical protein n=1 Tax=uncultured Roseobacter sp. TaxID=114847 RepID=UPI00261A47C8|nr:hypothetical protein [uncultured Roseobacter sp.]
MAFVKRIERDDREITALHPTQLICRYIVSERNGKRLIQLNTHGSDDRDTPGKLSQTLQFDEQSAAELYQVLKREFGFKGE